MVMIKDRIREDMKAAMRSHDADRLSTIRLLLAAIKQREIDEKIDATDDQVMEIITKMVKQRRDSVEQYRAGGREDLAGKEQNEIDVLSGYLPKQLTDDEVIAIIDEAVAAAGVTGMVGMGKVMGAVKAKVTGRADLGKVSALVKARLTAK
ncbi:MULTISPECIES: GatB/YqeY domain-containing protein [Sutterella]|nr:MULTISPECIES: GatB/YqeY domain-containing protein [Sutterella]